MKEKKVIFLAIPHGVCAGVQRALDAVEEVLRCFPPPVYVLGEIVHNSFIVEGLRKRGVRFADSLDEVPQGAVLLFSAHGVSAAIESEARRKRLRIVDASCPLVKRLHRAAAPEREVLILIGHRGHPEIEGTIGRSGAARTFVVGSVEEIAALPEFSQNDRIGLLAQTTLNTDFVREMENRLRERYGWIDSAAAVCYATTNRQRGVRLLAERCKLVLVIGSKHSSNSNRLREVAEQSGAEAYLIDGPEELPEQLLRDAEAAGVAAGASVPEILVQQLLEKLREFGFDSVEKVLAAEETIQFRPPRVEQ